MADPGPSAVADAIGGPVSLGEEVLGGFLELAHRLHPDEVATATAERARLLGADHAELFLVDHEQRVLLALASGEGSPTPTALDIDTTLAGRVYRTTEPVEGEGEGGCRRLWLPLLDGAERLGVMAVSGRSFDDVGFRRFRWLASVVAQLLVTKAAYGDTLVMARRRQEMRLAAELRWAMLPPLSFASDLVEIAASLEPAYDLAGDSFDYAVNGSVVHLALLDAMGHGLEASRMANLAVASYRHSRRYGLDLVESFMAIDAAIAHAFGPEHFVTGQLATLDLRTGRLASACGGHPLPILLRGTALVGELAGETCMPMGLGQEPTVTEVQLEPGDRVVFYTDGVIEARSPTGEEFGIERLGDLLGRAAAAEEPPAEMLRRLTHSVLAHEAGQLRDDASLLLVGWRRGPGGGASTPAEGPATPS